MTLFRMKYIHKTAPHTLRHQHPQMTAHFIFSGFDSDLCASCFICADYAKWKVNLWYTRVIFVEVLMEENILCDISSHATKYTHTHKIKLTSNEKHSTRHIYVYTFISDSFNTYIKLLKKYYWKNCQKFVRIHKRTDAY